MSIKIDGRVLSDSDVREILSHVPGGADLMNRVMEHDFETQRDAEKMASFMAMFMVDNMAVKA